MTDLAKMVDHTLLAPEATKADVDQLVKEATELGVCAVCVSPSLLPLDVPEGLKVVAVVGFPSGASKPAVKALEAQQACADGADEVDMVLNLANAVEGDYEAAEAEVQAVRDAVPDAVLKVIVESALLTDDQLAATCVAAKTAGADFVKTSTGFHAAGGATTHAVKVMRDAVGPDVGVKAAGGIRDAKTAQAMVDAGANRLGTSATAKVLQRD